MTEDNAGGVDEGTAHNADFGADGDVTLLYGDGGVGGAEDELEFGDVPVRYDGWEGSTEFVAGSFIGEKTGDVGVVGYILEAVFLGSSDEDHGWDDDALDFLLASLAPFAFLYLCCDVGLIAS